MLVSSGSLQWSPLPPRRNRPVTLASMIESVQARHRGAFNFEDHYDNLCALQDSAPLPAVKAHLPQGIIDLNGDRVRWDW